MPAKVIYLYPQRMAEFFCVHCGVELPRGIDRCQDCGKALIEICEIVFDFDWYETYEYVFFGHVYEGRYQSEIPKLKFLAKVTEGPYISAGLLRNVGESLSFDGEKDGPESDNQEHINALDDLAKQLAEDGWQPLQLPPGDHWYSRKFKRRVW